MGALILAGIPAGSERFKALTLSSALSQKGPEPEEESQ